MTKDEFVQWAVEEKICKNEYSAYGVWNWNGSGLWNYTTATAKRMAKEYREWRKYCNDTKLCFAYVDSGIEVPESFKLENRSEVSCDQG